MNEKLRRAVNEAIDEADALHGVRTPSTKENVAAKIRRLRLAQGWSMYRLAQEAGVSAQYVGDLEKAEKMPSLEVAAKLAVALGVGLETFDDCFSG